MSAGQRFVLSGGPSIGKTTLANELQARGYAVVREAARDIIQEETAAGSKLLPTVDKLGFQRLVVARQLEREAAAPADELVFCDRGLPDGIAYLMLDDIPIFEELASNAAGRYRAVFILAPLPHYEEDGLRRENPQMAAEVHELIRRAYQNLNYPIVEVPVMPVQERLDYLLEQVERLP